MRVMFQKNGLCKEVKSGFSWTTFLFGGFAQFFRGEILVGLLLCFFPGSNLIYAFFANKYTARRLVENGWSPMSPDEAHIRYAMQKWNIAV